SRICRDGCHREISHAGRGDRMIDAAEIPDWAAFVTALLLLVGAAVTLVGSIGLLRLGSFYERVHAPTLGTTLGAACILLASIIYFSVLQSRPILHEILIAACILITTPVTLILLVRASVYRDRTEGTAGIPQLERFPDAAPETAAAPPDARA